MSKVDWSLAPEGATHWDASTYRVNSFMKLSGEDWFFWPPESDSPSWNYWGSNSRHDTSEMIERPKQPQAWSGPEDGLPPVNSVCEINHSRLGWVVCEIVAHKHMDCGGKPHAIAWIDGNNLDQSQGNRFRPIKTPEQIASEKRESAIREFMDLVGIDCRVTASKAVDAGFKREVV